MREAAISTDNKEQEEVILVDRNDRPIGSKSKLLAHRDGDLHRAFSVFLFNDNGELLLQKRAISKYHSGGLWSNTCCSHPRIAEDTLAAAQRRLNEEMGLDLDLDHAFSFTYRVQFESGLWEHEYDHVFFGNFNGQPIADPDEVSDWKWMSMTDLEQDINRNPHVYTFWFKFAYAKVSDTYKEWRRRKP